MQQARLVEAVNMLCLNDKLEGNLKVDLRGSAEEILEAGIERKRNGGKMGVVEGDGKGSGGVYGIKEDRHEETGR